MSTGAIVGLAFAGVGAAVIAFGACYIVRDVCEDWNSKQSRQRALNREATYLCPGEVTSVETLTPQQIMVLRNTFDERANDSFELSGKEAGKLYEGAALLRVLHRNLYGDGSSQFGRRPNISWTQERSALFFCRADRKRQNALDFDDYCALFVRCRLEGEVAAATFTAEELEGQRKNMSLFP